MQNVGTMIRRPVPLGTAAASWIVALLVGVVIALTAPGLTAALSNSAVTSGTAQSTAVVGAQQIAHNREEEGFVTFSSVGGEQVSHNRSEEGLGGN